MTMRLFMRAQIVFMRVAAMAIFVQAFEPSGRLELQIEECRMYISKFVSFGLKSLLLLLLLLLLM